MCIVPGLGFNHGVRGFAKAFLSILGFLGGGAVGLVGIIAIDQKYHGFWTPALFCMAFTFLLGFMPGFKPALRWTYSALVTGVATTMWMVSRPKMHKDLMDSWYRLGPKATLVVATIGAIGFLIAYAVQQKRPPLFWMTLLLVEAGLVGYFSSALGGSPHTVHLLQQLFHLDPALAERLSWDIRKTLHFSFYGIIGLSAYRLASGSGVSGKSLLVLGLSFAFFYASFDELRQSDAADRQSSIVDVALDMAGAATFCALAHRRKAKPLASKGRPGIA